MMSGAASRTIGGPYLVVAPGIGYGLLGSRQITTSSAIPPRMGTGERFLLEPAIRNNRHLRAGARTMCGESRAADSARLHSPSGGRVPGQDRGDTRVTALDLRRVP